LNRPARGVKQDRKILRFRMTQSLLRTRLLAAFSLLFFWGTTAHASGSQSLTVSKNDPVMLTAQQVSYDEPNATAIASGHVEVVQGDTILFADKVTYNQNTDMVHAMGHVSVLEPTGDVFFSDDAELKNDMEKGVVKEFRARLKDNSLFAAREARRLSKQVTVMKDVVYSPCKVCQAEAGQPAKEPLWQIAAEKATIDENEKRVRYQNAIMDIYGFPVIYTPYFSHPTPDAPNQSGLLQPQYYHDSILGSVVKEPVYYTFAPNLDMTLTPWYMTNEHPLLETEVRGLSQNGSFYVHGAIADAYNRDDLGDVVPGDWIRGYIEAHGKLQVDKYWDVGLDAEHASDQTVLQFYHFGWQDMLTSRLFAERIEDRSYFSVESLAFQGLTVEDQASASPYILPQANFHFESDPLAAHSRIQLDSNALVLERSQGDTDQRLSTTAAWKLPYITHDGQVFELAASLRGDAYHVSDQITDPTTGAMFNGDTGRVIPQADLNWRYPFISRLGDGKSLMIAPIVEMTASPNLHQTSNIPNEDSQIAELSDINLFSPDRFAGLDQIESGLRGTYGTRGQLQMADEEYLEWLFGQAYQENETSPFPLTSAQVAHYSDYIGRLELKYNAVDVAYSFRLDRQTFAPTSNEVNASYKLKPLSLDATYLSLQNDPLFGDRKEVFGNATFDITPRWAFNLGGRRDLGSSEEEPVNTALPVSALNPLEPTAGTVGLNSGIVFHNECMMVTTMANRSYISQQDVRPSTTFGVTVVLKNFGAQDQQSNASAVAGVGNITAINEGSPINSVQNPVSAAGTTNSGSGGN